MVDSTSKRSLALGDSHREGFLDLPTCRLLVKYACKSKASAESSDKGKKGRRGIGDRIAKLDTKPYDICERLKCALKQIKSMCTVDLDSLVEHAVYSGQLKDLIEEARDRTQDETIRNELDKISREYDHFIRGLKSEGSSFPPTPAHFNTDLEFDVFLCHNSKDKPAVRAIGERLKERGLRPWLDEWEIRPGFPWLQAIEEHIECIKSVAVFFGAKGMGPWQDSEQRAAIQQFIERKCPVIPVFLAGCEGNPKLPLLLQQFHRVDFRESEPDPFEQLVFGITGKREWQNT